jgi:CDP-diacylglycerol--glycerol-3-phosphate 3-phosphatidyltransferase
MRFTLPNSLTWFRILAIPLVVVLYYLPVTWAHPAAGWMFALAGITDLLDGYLARKLHQTSKFGAFLDPVADKLIVAVSLVLIVQGAPNVAATLTLPSLPEPYLALVAAIIIGREIMVSALREWMSQIGAQAQVAVSSFGKWKTTVQLTGIGMMLHEQPLFGLPVYRIGIVLLSIAAALTIWSMIGYLRASWPAIKTVD